MGLVDDVVDGDDAALQAAVDALLGRLKKPAPQAVAATKRLLAQVNPPADLREAATRAFAASLRGTEAPEGLSAFAQKRRARWAE